MLDSLMTKDELRKEILDLVERYRTLESQPRTFAQGETPVPPSGRYIGASELRMMADAVLDGWLTSGRFNTRFDERLADYLGVHHVVTTNSGSSANLLALSALTSPKLGDKRLSAGDEIITVAAAFPTTVNPILQNSLIPVFVDVHIPTYNIDVTALNDALSPRTRGIIIAHTLGNPFNVRAIKEFVDEHDLWLIEDCCDVLRSEYDGKKVDIARGSGTLSFYPAHHITMGEGGAVFTNNNLLRRILESLRVRPEMNCLISSSCDPSNENPDACDHKPCLCTGDGGFEILGEASAAGQSAAAAVF